MALQRQIYEAARKLSLEDHLSKPQKKSRLQQCKREERKVKELQEAVLKHRIKSECNSPCLAVSSDRSHGEWRRCPLEAAPRTSFSRPLSELNTSPLSLQI